MVFCFHATDSPGVGRRDVLPRFESWQRASGVFRKAADYLAFLKLIDDAVQRLPVRVLSYCLIPNHFHLVLWPHGDGRKKGTFYFSIDFEALCVVFCFHATDSPGVGRRDVLPRFESWQRAHARVSQGCGLSRISETD